MIHPGAGDRAVPKVSLTQADFDKLVAAGHIKVPGNFGKGAKKRSKSKELAEPSFDPEGPNGGPVWVVPLKTVSEANQRGWHGKANRTTQARSAVCKALGAHLRHVVPFAEAYHRGEVVKVIITRIGGHGLDRMANLGSAMKAVEDAVALLCGANDGAANWHARAEQKPGGPMGVMIELITTGDKP